ncbi:hypothetical protein AXF42_Ash021688 [Apostasia shenzhenica]|uniref:Uncharacterized protein n=1 Tax=Apostasia shenzhenica TaxID=1088818 RepID=A0A2H9ZWF5_9ASPA|nr:hypothetical protein AXF42_Ash021688 [Apostasia shenzhenica]
MRRTTPNSKRRRDRNEQQRPDLTGAWRSIGDHTAFKRYELFCRQTVPSVHRTAKVRACPPSCGH